MENNMNYKIAIKQLFNSIGILCNFEDNNTIILKARPFLLDNITLSVLRDKVINKVDNEYEKKLSFPSEYLFDNYILELFTDFVITDIIDNEEFKNEILKFYPILIKKEKIEINEYDYSFNDLKRIIMYETTKKYSNLDISNNENNFILNKNINGNDIAFYYDNLETGAIKKEYNQVKKYKITNIRRDNNYILIELDLYVFIYSQNVLVDVFKFTKKPIKCDVNNNLVSFVNELYSGDITKIKNFLDNKLDRTAILHNEVYDFNFKQIVDNFVEENKDLIRTINGCVSSKEIKNVIYLLKTDEKTTKFTKDDIIKYLCSKYGFVVESKFNIDFIENELKN